MKNGTRWPKHNGSGEQMSLQGAGDHLVWLMGDFQSFTPNAVYPQYLSKSEHCSLTEFAIPRHSLWHIKYNINMIYLWSLTVSQVTFWIFIFVGAGLILIDSTRPYSMGQRLHFQDLKWLFHGLSSEHASGPGSEFKFAFLGQRFKCLQWLSYSRVSSMNQQVGGSWQLAMRFELYCIRTRR